MLVGGFWCYRYLGRTAAAGLATRPGPHPPPQRRGGIWKLAVAAGGLVCLTAAWAGSQVNKAESAAEQQPGAFAQWRMRLADGAKERALAEAQRDMSKMANAAADVQSAVKAMEALARDMQQK